MEILQYLLIELLLTAFVYLLIPTIIVLCYKNRKLSKKNITIITIINALLVWLIIMIIRIEGGDESTNYSIILWGWISYFYMKHFCLIPDNFNKDYATNLYEQEVKVEKNRYCSICGNKIDPITKICIGCNKQYFKGFELKSVLIVVLVIIMLCSISFNFIQYKDLKEIEQTVAELKSSNSNLLLENLKLEKESTEWKNKYNEIMPKLGDYDRVVVFIENDGTSLYHKYECDKFVGNDFYAFNVEYAEYKGYNPCQICIK